MTKSPLSMSLAPRVRKTVAPRPPRAEYKVPHVRKDEVEIAGGILASYNALAPHVEVLTTFALESRDSAYALVRIGWAFAQVEKNHFKDRQWFFNKWVPTMKDAQMNGDEMDSHTKEDSRIRLSNAERNVLICCIGPMFGTGLSTDLCDTVAAAIVGKRGSHLRMSLEILRVANGLESLEEVIKVIRAEAAARADEADVEESEDTDEAEAAK